MQDHRLWRCIIRMNLLVSIYNFNRTDQSGFDSRTLQHLPDHIGPNEHASFEEYRDWKAKLFTLCKTGIFNVDDANAAYMMEHATCEKLTYGECADADYRAKDIELYREKGVLGIQYALCGKLDAKIVVDLPGEFSVHNSLAAVAVADQMQVGITDIQNILKVGGNSETVTDGE